MTKIFSNSLRLANELAAEVDNYCQYLRANQINFNITWLQSGEGLATAILTCIVEIVK